MCDLCPTREHWADVMEQPEHWFGDMGDVFHSDPRGHIAPIFQVAGTAAMRTVADALGIAEDTFDVFAAAATASFMADFGHRHTNVGTAAP